MQLSQQFIHANNMENLHKGECSRVGWLGAGMPVGRKNDTVFVGHIHAKKISKLVNDQG
jgi:hypothetical protein